MITRFCWWNELLVASAALAKCLAIGYFKFFLVLSVARTEVRIHMGCKCDAVYSWSLDTNWKFNLRRWNFPNNSAHVHTIPLPYHVESEDASQSVQTSEHLQLSLSSFGFTTCQPHSKQRPFSYALCRLTRYTQQLSQCTTCLLDSRWDAAQKRNLQSYPISDYLIQVCHPSSTSKASSASAAKHTKLPNISWRT